VVVAAYCGDVAEWEKLPKYRCAKLVASYPRRLEAVIPKGGSTKYCVMGLNVNVIFLYFNTFAKISKKTVFAWSLLGIVCRLMRGIKN
jgi:hypothetical protein